MNDKAYFRASLLMVVGGTLTLAVLGGILIAAYLQRHKAPARPHLHVRNDAGVMGVIELPQQASTGEVSIHVHQVKDGKASERTLYSAPICTNECYVRQLYYRGTN